MDSEIQEMTILDGEKSVMLDRLNASQSVDTGHFPVNLRCFDSNPSRTASSLEIKHERTLFFI